MTKPYNFNGLPRLLALLTAVLLAGVRSDAATDKDKPDAILQLNTGSVAAGVGVNWGHGTLSFHGKQYPVAVKGLSVGNVGVQSITAHGEVFNLQNLSDFDGNYTSIGAGITVGGGRGGVTMENQNGVRVSLNSTTRGVEIGLGAGGVQMKLK